MPRSGRCRAHDDGLIVWASARYLGAALVRNSHVGRECFPATRDVGTASQRRSQPLDLGAAVGEAGCAGRDPRWGCRQGATKVKQVIAVGLTEQTSTIKALLAEDGICVTLVRDLASLETLLTRVEHVVAPSLVLARILDAQQLSVAAGILRGRGIVWAGLAVRLDSVINSDGYRAGAAAMVPIDAAAPVLADLARRLIERAPTRVCGNTASTRMERVFRIGETLMLPPGHVCVIRSGVVALHGADTEGTPILLGFAGAGEAIIPADEVADTIAYVAHTTVVALSMHWDHAIHDTQFHDAQSARIASMEAWARAQADPYLEGRILHTLRVLARLVGKPHARGTFIAARITHAQLAAAVCATRSTVTRLVGTMRQNEALLWVRDSDNEVGYCLPHTFMASQDRRA